MTVTDAGTSFCFCSYFEAPVTVSRSSCSRSRANTSAGALSAGNAAPSAAQSSSMRMPAAGRGLCFSLAAMASPQCCFGFKRCGPVAVAVVLERLDVGWQGESLTAQRRPRRRRSRKRTCQPAVGAYQRRDDGCNERANSAPSFARSYHRRTLLEPAPCRPPGLPRGCSCIRSWRGAPAS